MDRTTGFAVTVAVFVTVVTGGMQVEDPPGVQVDDTEVQGEINPDSYLAERNESIQASDLSHPRQKRREPIKHRPDESVSQMISRLMMDYNKQESPHGDKPTLVRLGIYVISFYSINEQTMDYSVSMYLRQAWNDHRLQFTANKQSIEQVRLGENKWNEIWIPDTFLRNEKAANFHLVTVENRMLKLKTSGDLWYVTKITATLSCPMNLEKFPMDTQECPMLFESFGYTMDTMYFQPIMPECIQMAEDLELPQFFIKNTSVIDCSQNYTTGAYPCLEFRFILQRDLGYFLIQVYVPSILIVILSWVSFWINVDASPARVSIGLLTVLTTTTMSSGARATLPRVSYIKAIDVWMIICLLFVFLSLIEYAVVNVAARKPARPAAAPAPAKQTRRLPPAPGSVPAPSRRDAELGTPLQPMGRRKSPKSLSCFKRRGMDGADGSTDPKPPERDGKYKARQVDKFSRKVFPLMFLVFNIVYWTFYTTTATAHPQS